MRNFLQKSQPYGTEVELARDYDEQSFIPPPTAPPRLPEIKKTGEGVQHELEQALRRTARLREAMTRCRKLIDDERKRLREVSR